MFYRDDLHDNGRELKMANCSSPCSLEEFKKALEAVTPSDWEAECGLVR